MQLVPAPVYSTSGRQKSHSQALISQHVINIPKIVRFMYQHPKSHGVQSLLATSKIYQSFNCSKDDSYCVREEKVGRKSVFVSKDYTFGNSQAQRNSSKFSLVSKQFKLNGRNLQKSTYQIEPSSKQPKTSVYTFSPKRENTKQTINYNLPVNHISLQAPPLCEFFECVPQKEINQTRTAQKRREKIFSLHSQNQLEQLTNEQKTNKKIGKRSEDINYLGDIKKGEICIKQRDQRVDELQIPASILQNWQMQKGQNEDLLSSAALQLLR